MKLFSLSVKVVERKNLEALDVEQINNSIKQSEQSDSAMNECEV